MKSVNWKWMGIAAFAVFFTIFATDFVIHGWWMKESYQNTASLWRTEDEMQGYMGWMLIGQFMIGAFLTWIFAKGYEGKGWIEGIRFGGLIGAFAVSHYFITYAVSPYPFDIFASWVVTGFMQAVLCGVVAAWVYHMGWTGKVARARR
ncbi:MAG: hypothetical protein IT285_15060 [Bdellovibrionales bacterium]|nr:hypothetical protein [Bdellovibrionales bacterium]